MTARLRPPGPEGRRGLAALGLTLLAVIGGPVAVRAQIEVAGELKTVATVRLEGRRNVPAGEIWAVLKTRKPSFWPWREKPALRLDFLRADRLAIAGLYKHYGFLDATADTQLVPTRNHREVIVVFKIHEGELSRIRAVEMSGVHSYPEAQLRRRLWAQPHRPFDPAYLGLDTLRISELYQERGFRPHTLASFERDSAALAVTTRYEVNEGPTYRVGEVLLTSPGALRLDQSLIIRELLLKPGEIYRRSRMQRSIEHLYQTGLFSQVQITPLPDSSNTRIDFHLQVRERKPRWIDLGVGSGTDERLRFTGQWGHANMDRHGLQGSISSWLALYGDGKFQRFRTEASLLERWLLRTRTSGQVTPFYEKFDERTDPRFVVRQQAHGVNFTLGRELTRFSRLSLTQENAFVHQRYEVLSDTLSPAVRDSIAGSAVPSYRTNDLVLAYDRDVRDNPIAAQRGSQQNLLAEISGGPLKGASSFRKGQIYSAWYAPVRTNWVLGARVRLGAIEPFGVPTLFSPDSTTDARVSRVPLGSRFHAGGVNSVRGYNENAIPPSGGLAVLQASLELRIPLVGPFGLELFGDAGNVWARPVYVKAKNLIPKWNHQPLDPSEMRYTFGAGGRLNLPFGPLRVDFAWSLRPDPLLDPKHMILVAHPQFAIGPSF